MKLVYLSSARIPSRDANSIHVMKMCQAFARLGHEVTLIAPDIEDDVEAEISHSYEFYGVDRCFELLKLPWRSFKGRGWVYGWEAAHVAKRLAADAAFGRCLQSCAVAARLGVPTVWDTHGLAFLQRRSYRLVFLWMINAREFKGIMTNCDALKRCILQDLPYLEDCITVAHNGADIQASDICPVDLHKTDGRPQVGYVGHLYLGKGLELIREMALGAPWADYHVVGGRQTTIELLRKDPTLPENVRLHGFVAPSVAERIGFAFDVLVAPYQSKVETGSGEDTAEWMSPLKLFGYMAASKPILCSDLPVLREIIQHGRNGLLLPADKPQAWIDALQNLMADPGERERLGANAYSDFLSRYTWQRRAGHVIDCLKQNCRPIAAV